MNSNLQLYITCEEAAMSASVQSGNRHQWFDRKSWDKELLTSRKDS